MIAFASLFLGLVLGHQKVDLVVEQTPASVQLLLDGRQLAKLSKPPWSATVDLGARLQPHRLDAVAVDESGAETSRATQWLNLPREPAEAALVLEPDAATARRARLVWHHIEYASAESVTVTFDGKPLALGADGTVDLPEHDTGRVHLLACELRFPDGSHYETEVAVGGPGGESAQTELTGVLVQAPGRTTPTVENAAERLRAAGQPLRIAAVEKTPASVLMVIDASAQAPLRGLADQGGALVSARTAMHPGDELRFLFPHVEMVARKDVPSRLFQMTQPFTAKDGSFGFVMTRVPIPPAGTYQRLTDAVAAAGLQAAAGSRARAVVLVLGPEPKDESAYSVDEVRRYLADLRVPLLVWNTGKPSRRTVSDDRLALTKRTPWGEARSIGSVQRLLAAVEMLRETVDDQYTVWVEGSHLPQAITLDAARTGWTLAGVQAR